MSRLVNVGLGPALHVQVQAIRADDSSVLVAPIPATLASIPPGDRVYRMEFEVRVPASHHTDEKLRALDWRDFAISGTLKGAIIRVAS
jgi:hypothetical protein